MFKHLTRVAMGVALLVGSMTAQMRSETIPVTTTNPALVGFVADVYGANFSTFSLVGFAARVDNFDFGSGTIESVPHTSYKTLKYTGLGFRFYVSPDYSWSRWCDGDGSATFNVQY